MDMSALIPQLKATAKPYFDRTTSLGVVVTMSYVWVTFIGICWMQALSIAKSVIWVVVRVLCPFLARILWGPGPWPPPDVLRTPEERFEGLEAAGYPFSPHYMQLANGLRVHYVDEGEAKPKANGQGSAQETFLFLHGEPTWSFLYRKMILPLVKAGHRCVAPDFIGFGRSDKYTKLEAYTHELHMDTVKQLVDKLDLTNVTLVVQDWGGLVGLSCVPALDARISRLVIMNTGLPPLPISHAVKYPLGMMTSVVNFLAWRSFARVLGRMLPVGQIIRADCARPVSSDVISMYDAPFPSKRFRAGAAVWPTLVPISPVDTGSVATACRAATAYLRDECQKPVLIMFSDGCPVTPTLDLWFKELMVTNKQVTTVPISRAGHFLQEDAGGDLAEHIMKWGLRSKADQKPPGLLLPSPSLVLGPADPAE